MAKFWWTVTKKLSQSDIGDYSTSTNTVGLRNSHELHFLEPFTEFMINHDKSREFFSCNSYYAISNHDHQLLFTGIQEHRCCWLQNPYDKVRLFDANRKPILQIVKTEFTGYLSTKMRFSISTTSGNRIGEVVRISDFMEKPKYEINDHHGDILFLMSIGHSTNGSRGAMDNFVTGKMGKMAHIREENSILHFKIYQATSVTEKALLLSLVLILDLARRAG